MQYQLLESVQQLASQLQALPERTLYLIDDGFARSSAAKPLIEQLDPCYVMGAGERCKSWQALGQLLDRMSENPQLEQLVAIGGGALLDLAGLAAHLFKRGVRYLSVPTTLLAMVDASLGGKCAINWRGSKNRVGAYQWPLRILSAYPVLGDDMGDPIVLCGMSEAYKHALIADGALALVIEQFLQDRDPALLRQIVPRAAKIKEQLVSCEQQKGFQGVRHLLNLGHTVAHGLEAALEGGIAHGRAVAIGLVVESQAQGFDLRPQQLASLQQLAQEWPRLSRSQWERFLLAMLEDKKGGGRKITLTKFGSAFTMVQPQSSYLLEISPEEIAHAWRASQR